MTLEKLLSQRKATHLSFTIAVSGIDNLSKSKYDCNCDCKCNCAPDSTQCACDCACQCKD